LRIIAGRSKGMPLQTIKGRNTRPTSDKVKESIFNIIQDRILDSVVLDLFAGTGNLGFESLSRGAKNDKSLGKILGQSVRNSMEAQLIIGGFIILFSVIINLLLQNRITSGPDNISSSWVSLGTGLSQIINPIIAGAMEITTGCQLLGEATLPFNYKLVAISLIIGWGGLSIHSQAISFLANTDLSTGVYFLSKLLHGVFSAIITYVLLWFHEVESVAAFGNLEHFINPTIGSTLIATGYLLASVVFIFIALYLIVILLKSVKIWDY
jgi:hypothetical protein